MQVEHVFGCGLSGDRPLWGILEGLIGRLGSSCRENQLGQRSLTFEPILGMSGRAAGRWGI